MRLHTFDALDPIIVSSLLPAFNGACGTNRMHKSAAIRLFLLIMKYPSVTVHAVVRNDLHSRKRLQQKRVLWERPGQW